MTQPTSPEAARVAAMTGPDLLAEADRLARCLDLSGMHHTAAILRRLAELLNNKG